MEITRRPCRRDPRAGGKGHTARQLRSPGRLPASDHSCVHSPWHRAHRAVGAQQMLTASKLREWVHGSCSVRIRPPPQGTSAGSRPPPWAEATLGWAAPCLKTVLHGQCLKTRSSYRKILMSGFHKRTWSGNLGPVSLQEQRRSEELRSSCSVRAFCTDHPRFPGARKSTRRDPAWRSRHTQPPGSLPACPWTPLPAHFLSPDSSPSSGPFMAISPTCLAWGPHLLPRALSPDVQSFPRGCISSRSGADSEGLPFGNRNKSSPKGAVATNTLSPTPPPTGGFTATSHEQVP